MVTPSQPNKPAQVVPPSERLKSKITAEPQAIVGSTSQTEHIPLIQTTPKQPLNPKLLIREVPQYPDPQMEPPLRPQDLKENWRTLTDLDIDINTDFEENSPYQEGTISEFYQRPDKSYIRDPLELGDLLDTSKLVQKFLPKQTNRDKILEIIQRKVLKGTRLPITVKEIQAGDLTSPYFKDFHLYLTQNKLPSKKSATHKVGTLAEKIIFLDSFYSNYSQHLTKRQHFWPYQKYPWTRSSPYTTLVFSQDIRSDKNLSYYC